MQQLVEHFQALYELVFDFPSEKIQQHVYNYLMRYILICTKACSYNKSCKDRIDRGGASDDEALAEEAILNELENNQRFISFF
ncbi:hypothetical protein [Candidatus Protochlamydia naegleriophila]|uniref:hypothetical protein n=1 Tax=Candidatus Protochlamydia naegleriophila TaxID=389348 RepID=UPI00073EA37B|nr:hypothetical protein [Candidatus Protochlamydia naegleriophila]